MNIYFDRKSFNRIRRHCSFCLILIMFFGISCNEERTGNAEPSTPDEARPWVFWYWMHGAVSKEGITADLEAMKETGIGGAYIFSIKDTLSKAFYPDPVRQLTPEYWEMVRFAFSEANRVGLKMAFNVSDGFATAGGPWITPELAMQKVVWSDTVVAGPQLFESRLPRPETNRDYYRDIAVYAFPAPEGYRESSCYSIPEVTTSLPGVYPQFLVVKGNTQLLTSREPCWFQLAFNEPFTCRSVVINCAWYNYQANRLKIEVSDDGINFTPHGRLEPYRHGWQDTGAPATHLIEPVTAKIFRFLFDPEGTEPGAEDLDNAKWEPELKIAGIELSGETKINQYEGKSGAAWRIAERTTEPEIGTAQCVDEEKMKNISRHLQDDGNIIWEVPEGKWVILRMGHTPTGAVNATGGGGKGPECDKLNPKAVQLQFDRWFAEAFRQGGKDAKEVLKIFHVDSWECGSQNWSPAFRKEFRKRRGYDLIPFLPVMAGIPVKNAELSEKVLYDIRLTISELVADNFYGTLAGLAKEKHCQFSAESIAPVFTGDGMLHFRETDLPMGEFWLRSPSHDKPNDILDAVSAGHVYGKNIIQAEAFTEIRVDWDEHPGNMKTLADLWFAQGINRMVFHVFTHNPWMDRKPGMTLDKVGTFLQRDQTWWKQGKAWNAYLTRCQALLQSGNPVVDIAVFAGEEIPSRAVLPDRLVDILPGLMGEDMVESERQRLLNQKLPLRELPAGVTTSANMADPADWANPLRGYKYDSFNRDALLNLARAEKERIVLPGGASYRLLLVPGTTKMNPDGRVMSVEVAEKLLELATKGATILLMEKPENVPGWQNNPRAKDKLKEVATNLFSGEKKLINDDWGGSFTIREKARGKIIPGPYTANSFNLLDLPRDLIALDEQSQKVDGLAWTHRSDRNREIYFISNQKAETRLLTLSFRETGKLPELYFPVTGEKMACRHWRMEQNHTTITYRFQPNESLFVLFEQLAPARENNDGNNWIETTPELILRGEWTVRFDPAFGGPENPVLMSNLSDWSKEKDPAIRFYSGTAVYTKKFYWSENVVPGKPVYFEMEALHDIAEIKLNGRSCGICWTPPLRVRIDEFLEMGDNELEIAVTNTWHNRLIGDHYLPEKERITWTTAPFRLVGRPLLPAGLLGPVSINMED